MTTHSLGDFHSAAHASTLGKTVDYADHYDASRLFPIARAAKRSELGIASPLPFSGVDIWNAWELSWLDPRGKPNVAIAEIRVPADSPCIIESKSFKLYLNGFNQERIDSRDALRERIEADLAQAAGAPVVVRLKSLEEAASESMAEPPGFCIDDIALDADIDCYGPPQPGLLSAGDEMVDELLVSHLLKSNCPVTGQPDWASVQISYRGPRIDRQGLLRYLVSFRRHDDFHEQCVERIFIDLTRRCAPERLTVQARYTRRGGLDINPWRSTLPGEPGNVRGARQ
ncbi:MAG: NADPH-dependent 7-cyano-7-deazaguanine reductase QueF [Aquimonas sp.]